MAAHGEDDPIVIVGLSFRLPTDVSTDEDFWQMLQEGRSASGPVPNQRFSLERYWHPNADRHGSVRQMCLSGGSKLTWTQVSTKNAYFLDRDMAHFDAPFFSMTSTEAAATDPQHRMLLESSYEAFENAGISMKSVVGSDTGVFIGGFGDEYRAIQSAEVYDQNQYQAVGTGGAMLSNRLSWFYDLRGPSFSLDTACSSSMVALHLACQSLKMGECSQALVGGVSLMLGPDTFISLSRLRFLSPDGVCHTFDHRANGYARGEGVGILVAKRLSDALRDGDTIRAVIRGTHINQDGKTPSITVPSATAQANLIRETYRKAGLDLAGTGYFEAHGTGTPQGDFQEMSAIAEVFSHRGPENPLYVGSVKTNVGHGEGLAGVNGLIKSVLMLERAGIPPLAGFEQLNPRLRLDDWNLKLPLEHIQWPGTGCRRISINSFGYGGTNGHAILDDAFHYLQERGLKGIHRTIDIGATGEQKTTAISSTPEPSWPQVLVFSSPEQAGVQRIGKAYRQTLFPVPDAQEDGDAEDGANPEALKPAVPDVSLTDLAYTLSQRRTAFEWRSFVVATSMEDASKSMQSDLLKYKRSRTKTGSAFVFTGQGAQWFAMGRELIQAPIFRAALERADKHLASLKCAWVPSEELKQSRESSRIDNPAFSQPLCTIIQIAMVDLLSSWGIEPVATLGHSSGEIAAAYALKAIGFEDACTLAYYRGLYSSLLPVEQPHLKGSMMAAAMSEDEALELLHNVEGRATVACVNSPSSVTISGDVVAIEQAEALLKAQGIWARRLRVDVAYHSHHMQAVAEKYLESIKHIVPMKSQAETTMFSSVTGEAITSAELVPMYWVENLLGKVNFSKAVTSLLTAMAVKKRRQKNLANLANISVFIEIGPHSALQGPLRQIMISNGRDHETMIPYVTMLKRNENAAVTALEAAATIWTTGVDVKLDVVNTMGTATPRRVLTDLPHYPWNHSRKHWHENRKSKNHRLEGDSRTDMLGARSTECSASEPRWTNILRPSAFPWILDHKMQGTILLPAACMVAMAVEAALQVKDLSKNLIAVELTEVSFNQAMVFHTEDSAIATEFDMRPYRSGTRSPDASGLQFRYCSFDGDNAIEHASGVLHLVYETPSNGVDAVDEDAESWQARVAAYRQAHLEATDIMDADLMYADIADTGLEFGPMFRNLFNIRYEENLACASIRVPDTASTMPGNYEYPANLHPVVIDAMFQSLLPAMKKSKELSSAGVPYRIGRLWLAIDEENSKPSTEFEAHITAHSQGQKNTIGQVVVGKDSWKTPVAILEDFIAAKLSLSKGVNEKAPAMVSGTQWCEDLTFPLASTPTFLTEKLEASRSQVREKIAAMHDARLDGKGKSICPSQVHGRQSPLAAALDMLAKLREQRQKASSLTSKALKVLTRPLRHGNEGHPEVSREKSETELLLVSLEESLATIRDGQSEVSSLFVAGGTGKAYLDRVLPRSITSAAVKSYLLKSGDKNPQQRILHVVSGSASFAEANIHELQGSRLEPTRTSAYTICSVVGTTPVLDTLTESLEFVNTAHYDAETGMIQQDGDVDAKYDVIIWDAEACTETMATAMAGAIAPLAQPGSRLLVTAATQPDPLLRWLIALKENSNVSSPAMDQIRWSSMLSQNGFVTDGAVLQDFEEAELHQLSLLMYTCQKSTDWSALKSVVLLQSEKSTSTIDALNKSLTILLNQHGVQATTEYLGPTFEPAGKLVVSLLDFSEQMTALFSMGPTEFQKIQSIFLESSGLLWLTAGDLARKTSDPFSGVATGLVRTMVTENAHLRTCQLDLSSTSNPDRAAKAVLRVIERCFAGDGTSAENEFAEADGMLYVPRVVRNHALSSTIANRGKPNVPVIGNFHQPGRVLKLKIGEPGLLDTLHFDDHPDLDHNTELDPHDVEIAVEANGMNFMDTFGAMGNLPKIDLGTEAAGRITKIGSKVTKHKVGDVVYGLISSSMATLASSDEELVHPIPPHMTMEEAVACPTTYFTAYLALIQGARLAKGETILIHAASGGLGQAAIQMAQHIGAEVFATVGTAEKKQLLMQRYGIPEDHIFSSRRTTFARGVKRLTNGRGVDVVLNSLAGEGLRESFKSTAEFGRFVEVGKRDAYNNTGLEMFTFLQHISFHFINLEVVALAEERSRYIDIGRAVWKMLDSGVYRPAYPLNVFNYCDVEQAFRLMQSGKHTGKLVLRARPDERVPVVPHDDHPMTINSASTVMLVGGLGGIGRSIADLFLANGARHIAFVSRTANNSKYVEYLKELEAKGVDARTFACDITDEASVGLMVQKVSQQMPPVKGLVQCAMVLRDTIFEKMTHDEWSTGTLPKINGTWNLHKSLPADLDFFIMLSSVSGVIGNGGQANYNAGNIFQDYLAHHRHALGTPAS
jgi:acyl transferase domain-containing protein/NADPH:quinone reductase-like Zn-dependent oxidoreductase